MRDFEYVEPTTLGEASALLSQLGEDARVIAGGNSLVVLMKQGLFRPKYLVNISRISGLEGVNCNEDGSLHLGALVTHRTLETSSLIGEKLPILSQMAKQVANVRVRNTGTIGGNLCHADPHSDPPVLLVALEARARVMSQKGERAISFDGFFLDYYETALGKDGILTEVLFPVPPPLTGSAYGRFTTRSQTGKPCLNVAVLLTLTPDFSYCERARIVIGGVGPIPTRVQEAEEVLTKDHPTNAAIEQAARIASKEIDPMSDLYGSEWYKREIVKVLVRQGVNEAIARAKESS